MNSILTRFGLINRLIEDIYLVYINIKNAFYNFYWFIIEVIKFYRIEELRNIDFEYLKIYSMKDQFNVSIEESQMLFPDSNDEFTYGEAIWSSIKKIMDDINPQKEQIFYDLGCGIGRICFFMSIFYKTKSYGIEILPSFVKNANLIKEKFKRENIFFIQDDWDKIDISNADIIYIAGTCLSESTFKKLQKKIENIEKSFYLISVSLEIKSEVLNLKKKYRLPFSWGYTNVFLYKSNNKDIKK